MEAREKEILNEVISGTKCQFVIPVFQRNYDWGEKECKRLFKDIIVIAENISNQDNKHFIGAFVYLFNKIVETSFNEYVLIDGQQRLTSITLILKALYDYVLKLGDEYMELANEIYETYLINKFAKKQNYKLKLKPNKLDDINFNQLMSNKLDDIDIQSNIFRNYKLFYSLIENMTVNVEDFYNAMQRIEGVSVVLNKRDNPQLIFESLNSTGLDLDDIDLIRNYLLMNVDSKEQEFLYEKYWVRIEKLLNKDFINLIKDFLSLKNGLVTSSTKNKAYTAFKKFYIESGLSVNRFLENLLHSAKIYSRLLLPSNSNNKLDKALKDFIRLKVRTTYPFILGLLLDNASDDINCKKISDENLTKILRLVESYLVRRNVCNLAGGGVSQLMAQLYKTLKDKYKESFYDGIYDKVAMVLVGITTKAYFPKNDEFKREFTERDMYKNRNIRFILEKFETYSSEKELVDFSTLSIEHVMPQKLTEDWIKELNEADIESFHEEYKNNIGNLTLTAYNSEMSNKSFSEKKVHNDFSRLNLNQYFKKEFKWNKDNIVSRAASLIDLGLEIWPYPKISNIENISSMQLFLMDDDDFSFSGTKPSGLELKSHKIIAQNWTVLFTQTILYLYKSDISLFKSLINNLKLINVDKPIFTYKMEELRVPWLISDNMYCETNSNTERKIQILLELLKGFRYEIEDVIIYLD